LQRYIAVAVRLIKMLLNTVPMKPHELGGGGGGGAGGGGGGIPGVGLCTLIQVDP
jgi:hypothetical protein